MLKTRFRAIEPSIHGLTIFAKTNIVLVLPQFSENVPFVDELRISIAHLSAMPHSEILCIEVSSKGGERFRTSSQGIQVPELGIT